MLVLARTQPEHSQSPRKCPYWSCRRMAPRRRGWAAGPVRRRWRWRRRRAGRWAVAQAPRKSPGPVSLAQTGSWCGPAPSSARPRDRNRLRGQEAAGEAQGEANEQREQLRRERIEGRLSGPQPLPNALRLGLALTCKDVQPQCVFIPAQRVHTTNDAPGLKLDSPYGAIGGLWWDEVGRRTSTLKTVAGLWV
jgi:hypothetical protein